MSTQGKRFHRMLAAFVLSASATLATVGLTAMPVQANPAFKAPWTCNVTWHASTYAGHVGNGVDFNNLANGSDNGASVLASAAGTVTLVPWDSDSYNYGNMIKINHGDGWETRYAHLASFAAMADRDLSASGVQVNTGDLLGYVGSTEAEAPHLHYEQRFNGAGQNVAFDGAGIAVGTSYTASDPTHTSTNCGVAASLDDIHAFNRVDLGSNKTARHVVNGTNWGQYLANQVTGLPTTDATWDFELGDLNGDGVLDLWGFNRNPGGTHTVVHVLNGANPGLWLQAGNIALPGVDNAWDFELGFHNGDSTPDIFGINRNPNGSNTVVHVINGANWGQWLQAGNIVLHGTSNNWDFAVGKYDGDGVSDIYAINRNDTGSNKTAMHVVNGANWGLYLTNQVTGLPVTDATWEFEVGNYNGTSPADLYAVNHNPNGAHTVVHVLNGADTSQWLQAGNIVLPGTTSAWDFEVGFYN